MPRLRRLSSGQCPPPAWTLKTEEGNVTIYQLPDGSYVKRTTQPDGSTQASNPLDEPQNNGSAGDATNSSNQPKDDKQKDNNSGGGSDSTHPGTHPGR